MASNESVHFIPVNPEDTEQSYYLTKKKSPLWRSRALWISILATISLLLTLGVLESKHVDPYSVALKEDYCGQSGEEALAAGCFYDQWLAVWLPPQCTDMELYDEFTQRYGDVYTNYQWFLDKDLSQPITDPRHLEMMRRGFTPQNVEVVWAAGPELHLTHCLYSLTKRARDMEKKTEITDWWSPEHNHNFQ